MPVTVKSIFLWRKEVENKTGLLAQTLETLAEAGADLGVVMGYRLPGNEAKAAIEIYPVSGKKLTAAATSMLHPSSSLPQSVLESSLSCLPKLVDNALQAPREMDVRLGNRPHHTTPTASSAPPRVGLRLAF